MPDNALHSAAPSAESETPYAYTLLGYRGTGKRFFDDAEDAESMRQFLVKRRQGDWPVTPLFTPRASPSLETREATAEPVAWMVKANARGSRFCYFDKSIADHVAEGFREEDGAATVEIIPLDEHPASPSIPREQQSEPDECSGSLVLAAAEWLIGAEGRARELGYTSVVDLSDALKATQQSEPSE